MCRRELFLTGCVVAAGLTGSSHPRLGEVLALLGVPLAVGIALLVRPGVGGAEHLRGVGPVWVPYLLAEQRWAAVVWLVCLPVTAGLLLATVSPGRGDSPLVGSAKLPATPAVVRGRGPSARV